MATRLLGREIKNRKAARNPSGELGGEKKRSVPKALGWRCVYSDKKQALTQIQFWIENGKFLNVECRLISREEKTAPYGWRHRGAKKAQSTQSGASQSNL